MADQERKTSRRKVEVTPDEASPSPKLAETGKQLKAGLDKLLDEIDSVLEDNAEEFVKSYVQRGGE